MQVEQKSFLDLFVEYRKFANPFDWIALQHFIRLAIVNGSLRDELAKMGYRKVRSIRVSFLDGAGFGYTDKNGDFQLIDEKEMFLEA